MAKQDNPSFLRKARTGLVCLRIVVLLVGAVVVIIFAGSFLVDVLFVSTSPIAQSEAVQWMHRIADPVVARLASEISVNTRFHGTETMPLIITGLVLALMTFLNNQAQHLLLWLDERQEERERELRRAGRKTGTGKAFATGQGKAPKSRLGGLLRGKEEAAPDPERFRKKLAFLAVEMADAAALREGKDPLLVERLSTEYRGLLESTLKQTRARASSWTADGVIACFLQTEVACNAAKSILRAVPEFNRKKNPLETPVQLRCAVHGGEVLYDESTPLDQLSDRVVDVTRSLLQAARPNSLLISQTVYEQIRDKSGFAASGEVEGGTACEWAAEQRALAMPARGAAATAGGLTTAGGISLSDMETSIGPLDETLAPGIIPAGASAPGGAAQRIGRYEVLAELGRGAMGVVYKAKDTQIGRIVAIKMILTASVPPQYLADYKKRFFREAQAAGVISHPGIVTIYDIAETESGSPYLVMEFVEGNTLENLLAPKREGEKAEGMAAEQALDIMIQVCEALDCAHMRGVIHRDIKPANLLVTVDGKAKLADFGIAKLEGAQLTQAGNFVGTPAFMSPEQFNAGNIDQRSDIFALGAVLYWMLTGEVPFPGKTITSIIFKVMNSEPTPVHELNKSLPDTIHSVVSCCLAKKPEGRYTTALEMAADLKTILAGGQVRGKTVQSTSQRTSDSAFGSTEV